MKGLFLCYLMVAAGQDWKKKSVELRIYAIFGVLAMGVLLYKTTYGKEAVPWINLLGSMGIGLAILGCSFLWRGGIGLGDGYFFLISGLMLEFWTNLALLCYGLLFCSSYCLCCFVWNQVRFHTNVRNKTVPFLPFLLPMGLWIMWNA